MATTPILNYQFGGSSTVAAGNPLPGFLYYWPTIENLSGGFRATDLDAQDISILQPDSLIVVVIADRGESQWLRVTDAGSPVTDLDGGVIVPTNYNAASRPYVLHRQLGF